MSISEWSNQKEWKDLPNKKTSASQHKMPCPNCHSPETRCMKSMYIAMNDYTEELWECEVCKCRWERTEKVTILRKE